MTNYKKIFEIMKKINSPINYQDLLSSIIDSAKDLLNAEGSSLLLLDKENDVLIFDIVISDKGEIIKGKTLKLDEGIAGYVAKTEEGLIVNDVTQDERFCRNIDEISGFHTRSIIAVPVSMKKNLIGVLEVVNPCKLDTFTNNDMILLKYLADAAAVSINNHDLLINLKNRVHELTCIYEISQSIYFTFDIEEFLQKILDTVYKIIKAERCSIIILNEKSDSVEHFASTKHDSFSVNIKDGFISHVIKTGDPIIVYDIDKEIKNFSIGSRNKNYSSNSFVCIPLKFQDKVIGILNVTDKQNGEIFDSFDLRVLSTVSRHVAESYMNVTLQKKIKEAEFKLLQERMSPHFLFNALNTIHSLIYRDVSTADQAVFKLAQIYRFIMEKSLKSMISFDEEWQFVANYLDMEVLQFGEDLKIQIDKEGDFMGVMIPPLTLQPIVENSIKHGFKNRTGNGYIKVFAKKIKNKIHVEVLDNGIGLKNKDDIYSRSLGNILQRLKFHFKDADLNITNRDDDSGVKVDLYLQAIN